jgi:hypothetical protein
MLGMRDYRRGLDWMIGFIDTLYTHHSELQLGNYSAIADLHTTQFTVTLVIFWERNYTNLTVTAAH